MYRSRGVSIRRDGEHGSQVIDHARLNLFHHVQDMAEVREIPSHQFYLVCHVIQSLCVAAHVEHDRSLLSPGEQHAHHLCADKACAAGNQCGHRCPPDKGCQ